MTNQIMVELDEKALEAVTGGGVHQSNYNKRTYISVFVSADTSGVGNTGGFSVKVIQKNTN